MTTISRVQAKSLAFTLTKVSAAALTLALVATPASAQPNTQTAKRKSGRPQRDARLRSHIPPIIIKDGSLDVESPDFSATSEQEHHPKTPRPHHYKKAGYGRIIRLAVVVMTENGPEVPYNQPLSAGARIELWLQKRGITGDYVWIDENNPQVIIRGNSLTIEMDKELKDCENTGNEERPRRCRHEGYGGVEFRIGRVRRVRGSGHIYDVPLNPNRSEVEIIIFMEHPHPLRGSSPSRGHNSQPPAGEPQGQRAIGRQP